MLGVEEPGGWSRPGRLEAETVDPRSGGKARGIRLIGVCSRDPVGHVGRRTTQSPDFLQYWAGWWNWQRSTASTRWPWSVQVPDSAPEVGWSNQ